MKFIIPFLFLMLIASCKQDSVKKLGVKDDISTLASDEYEGLETDIKEERKAAVYIAERFKAIGLKPKGSDGFFQTYSFKNKTDSPSEVSFNIQSTDSTIAGMNVLGYVDNKAANTIIIGANYDYLDHGGERSLYREKDKAIHNGADDTASGVAVVLNLAVKLKKVNTKNNYLFMAFSGEDMGLLVGNYFVKNPAIDIKTINYMINMDMVGRLKADKTLMVYGTGTSPMFKQVLRAANKNFKLIENESSVGPSDHTSFYMNDIPVLHFFLGEQDDYSKRPDDWEKLNYEGMELISDLILEVITDLNDIGKLEFR